MTALETQYGGNHYARMKVQPVEFILSNGMGFCEGSVVKYVSRWRGKGGMEDLRKAKHFIEILIDSPKYRAALKNNRHTAVMMPAKIGPSLYCEENGIPDLESLVITSIWLWNVNPARDHLQDALAHMDELITALLAEEAKTFACKFS